VALAKEREVASARDRAFSVGRSVVHSDRAGFIPLQAVPILVGIVFLVAGVLVASSGLGPIGLILVGIGVLIFTGADVEIWKVTMPLGGFLILVGSAWLAAAPYIP
jgi:hypothetical protein